MFVTENVICTVANVKKKISRQNRVYYEVTLAELEEFDKLTVYVDPEELDVFTKGNKLSCIFGFFQDGFKIRVKLREANVIN